MFLQLFVRVLSIFFIIFVGAFARKKKFLNDETTSTLATCITNFFYPALIVSSITSGFTIKSLISNWLLPAGTILIMGIGYLTGMTFIKFLSFDSKKQENTFLFQCTINNYVFLPLPIVAMLLGNTGVAYLVFSSLGSEISVWTIGILGLTGNHFEKKAMKNLLSSPMVALVLSILIIFIRDHFVYSGIIVNNFLKMILQMIGNSIDMFGKATVPLALFTAGSRMAHIKIHHIKTDKQLWLVFLRLVFIPAFACAVISLLPVSREIFLVLITVAIMPAAIASIILSDTYHADTEFASSSVLLTNIVSLLTIPLWLTLLNR